MSANVSSLVDEEIVHSTDDEVSIPTINDVESLKKGTIKVSKKNGNAPYTIILVGESGVGKSSFVEFIANVLLGNGISHCKFDILDSTNEQGSSGRQSQTGSVYLYEFVSQNGIMLRILDTPGFPQKRDTQQDEFHKSVATQIKKHTESVTAVLVFTNGTVLRDTGDLRYALSTLAAVFPNGLANNIALMLTNVADHFSSNFSQDTIPGVLKGARQFQIDNPVALQTRYLKVKGDRKMKNKVTKMSNAMKSSERKALKMLVALFDWLDGLEPQPTTKQQVRKQSNSEQMKESLKESLPERVWSVKGIFIGESRQVLGKASPPLYPFVIYD